MSVLLARGGVRGGGSLACEAGPTAVRSGSKPRELPPDGGARGLRLRRGDRGGLRGIHGVFPAGAEMQALGAAAIGVVAPFLLGSRALRGGQSGDDLLSGIGHGVAFL